MKPIEKIESAIMAQNGIGLVGYKSMARDNKDTLHLINVNGNILILQDYHDERGSYKLFSSASNEVKDDIDFIKSL